MVKIFKDFPNIDREWTLFLDRDGTINQLLYNDYVKSIDEFQFIPGTKEAIKIFSQYFKYIIVVTNQQGIGKELMTHEDLAQIHQHMIDELTTFGGRIDQVFYCPHLSVFNPSCRKPNIGMAMQAAEALPDIDFKKSIMIGDSPSDIEFGNILKMYTIWIQNDLIDEKIFANMIISDLKELSHLFN